MNSSTIHHATFSNFQLRFCVFQQQRKLSCFYIGITFYVFFNYVGVTFP
nr:MAG TPA: hypothetical protein [Caudoviricetes sp.]